LSRARTPVEIPIDEHLPDVPDGMTARSSSMGPKETMDKLAAAVTGRGLAIFARIDHAAAAAKVGMQLRPTEVLIFGNARAGTPLMQASQTIGVDLPLKVLVWQDVEGRTWLGYNDPSWLAKRHRAQAGVDTSIGSMTEVLAAMAREATADVTRAADPAARGAG
jgi:uncharacterized protein (DUF302 family)